MGLLVISIMRCTFLNNFMKKQEKTDREELTRSRLQMLVKSYSTDQLKSQSLTNNQIQMGDIVSVSGHVGADVKVKEKLQTVVFAYFPFYVKYINTIHKPAANGTKVMIALTDDLARKYFYKIERGHHLKIEGELRRTPYVDENGVTRDWESIYATSIEFL